MKFKSQAGGMAVARPYGFEIDFLRNPISVSAAWFFVIILKFIFQLFFKSKFMQKFLDNIKIIFKAQFSLPAKNIWRQ